jgi:hypothetical protein
MDRQCFSIYLKAIKSRDKRKVNSAILTLRRKFLKKIEKKKK